MIGSIVGTRQDLTEVFELHARGRTTVVAETRKLDEVNDGDRRGAHRPGAGQARLRVLNPQSAVTSTTNAVTAPTAATP